MVWRWRLIQRTCCTWEWMTAEAVGPSRQGRVDGLIIVKWIFSYTFGIPCILVACQVRLWVNCSGLIKGMVMCSLRELVDSSFSAGFHGRIIPEYPEIANPSLSASKLDADTIINLLPAPECFLADKSIPSFPVGFCALLHISRWLPCSTQLLPKMVLPLPRKSQSSPYYAHMLPPRHFRSQNHKQ